MTNDDKLELIEIIALEICLEILLENKTLKTQERKGINH